MMCLLKDADRPDGLLEEAEPVMVSGFEEDRCLWRYRFASRLFWHTAGRLPFPADERVELCRALAEYLAAAYGSEVRKIAPVLARLYTEAGDAQQAEHYHTLAHNVGTVASLYCEAQAADAGAKDRLGTGGLCSGGRAAQQRRKGRCTWSTRLARCWQ